MRASHLLSLLSLASIPTCLAKKKTDASADEPTIFNDKSVPPITMLKGETFDEVIKDGNWLVEFFSPYCWHCQHFAPTWQTLYEFYYTSDPLPQTPGSGESHNDLNSFTRFYNYKFAKVDCVANGDLCNSKDIKSFPTVVYFKNGEKIKDKVGGSSMKEMSVFVEEQLESIKPGSRPQGGVKVPKAGDHTGEQIVLPDVGSNPQAKFKNSGTATQAKAKTSPNPAGKSFPLSAENFQRLVTMTHDPWLIKFYAPWCHHCQQMAPNWEAMARQMKGRLNIGEVNCDVEKRLCKDVKVHGYPTIIFFRGAERIEYDGLRGVGDLIDYAEKASSVSQGVKTVDAQEFEALEKKEEVIFLYFFDHATTSEDFQALENLLMGLVGRARLVKTNDSLLADRFKISTWPRLVVSRDGKPSYYTGLSPRDMRDQRRIMDWMRTVWLPLVPEMTASNAKEIMRGKLVVLGILSRERPEEIVAAKREIKNAALEWIDKQTQAFRLERQELRDAKQLRIEEAEDRNDQRALRAAKAIRINMDDIERKDVAFAWVDGIFWERWIRTTFGVTVKTDNERVVMYDHDSHRYWDNTMTGNPIVPSRTSILETLPRVVANPPKIQAKSTTTVLGHIWYVSKEQVFEHPRVTLGIVVGTIFGIVLVYRRHWRSQAGYFRVGEKGGPMDGLLGGGGNAQTAKKD